MAAPKIPVRIMSNLLFTYESDRGVLAGHVAMPRCWLRFILDHIASLIIVVELTLVPDALICICSSIASVLLWAIVLPTFSVNLTWTALSFILVFPLQSAIKDAYSRRETAVAALADFRATIINIFMAHATWDWTSTDAWYGRFEDNIPKDKGGKGVKKGCFKDTPLAADHAARVHYILVRMLEGLQELLLIQRHGRARHALFVWDHRMGREARMISLTERTARKSVLTLINRLHRACDAMKAAGLPPAEAARLHAHGHLLTLQFERIWCFKVYRTTIALRALARVTILALPFIYGPYWLYIASGGNGKLQTGTYSNGELAFAMVFCAFFELLLISMLQLALSLENPYSPHGRESVRVVEELSLCREALEEAAEDLKEKWNSPLQFEWEVAGGWCYIAPNDIMPPDPWQPAAQVVHI